MAAVRPGDGPIHQDHIVRLVDLDDLEVTNGDPLVPPPARHFLTLLDLPALAAVGGVRTNAAPRAVVPLNAVAGPQAVKVMLLHHARGPAPLDVSDDIHVADLGEDSQSQLLPHLDRRVSVFEPEFSNESRRLAGGLGDGFDLRLGPGLGPLAADGRDVPALGPRRQASRLFAIAELNGAVAVALGSAHLQDGARTGLDHGDSDGISIFTVNLRHSDFATEKTDSHGSHT